MLLLFVHPFTHLLISTSVRLSYFHRHSARFHFKRVLCPSHYHIEVETFFCTETFLSLLSRLTCHMHTYVDMLIWASMIGCALLFDQYILIVHIGKTRQKKREEKASVLAGITAGRHQPSRSFSHLPKRWIYPGEINKRADRGSHSKQTLDF